MISLILVATAWADAPTSLEWEHSGESRTRMSSLSNYPVDAEGNSVNQPLSLHQRLRLGLEASWNDLDFATEWDVLTGQIAGDTWSIQGSADEQRRDALTALSTQGILPRRASVKGMGPIGQWEVGLMPSYWGLGMVANDGAHAPLFGHSDFGDRVFRARNTTQPFGPDGQLMPVYLTVGIDRVFADDMARMTDGQVAWQGIGSALYKTGDLAAGAYVVYRYQQEPAEEGELHRATHAGMLDGTVAVPLALNDAGWRMVVEIEAAGIVGRTDRATTYDSPEQVRINSGGAATRLRIRPPGDSTQLHFRSGFASGDARPDDGLSTTFTMDRDFDAGMVLFHELLGSVDAATHVLLSDPDRSGQPPDGLDTLTAEGALRSAVYAQPVIQWTPRDLLDLRVGGMMAWSTSPIRQAYYSHRAGGVARNHHNKPAGGYELGSELNWSVGTKGPEFALGSRDIAVSGRVQGGHAFLSDQLAGQGVDTLHLVTGTLNAAW